MIEGAGEKIGFYPFKLLFICMSVIFKPIFCGFLL